MARRIHEDHLRYEHQGSRLAEEPIGTCWNCQHISRRLHDWNRCKMVQLCQAQGSGGGFGGWLQSGLHRFLWRLCKKRSCDCETWRESLMMPLTAKETRSFTLRVKMGTKGLQSWWTTQMMGRWVSWKCSKNGQITAAFTWSLKAIKYGGDMDAQNLKGPALKIVALCLICLVRSTWCCWSFLKHLYAFAIQLISINYSYSSYLVWIWRFPEMGVPHIINFNRTFHYKPPSYWHRTPPYSSLWIINWSPMIRIAELRQHWNSFPLCLWLPRHRGVLHLQGDHSWEALLAVTLLVACFHSLV